MSKSFCCHKSNKTKGGGSSLSLTLFYVNDHVIRVVVVAVAVVFVVVFVVNATLFNHNF